MTGPFQKFFMLNRFRLFVFLLGAALTFCGCGGGGGGNSSGTLNAVADWSQFSQPISGNSMQWTLFTPDEIFVQSIAINRDNPGDQSAQITGLDKGLYHLRVELFSNRDLSGSLVGVLDELIAITNSTTYRAAVGEAPASVKVTPANATFKANEGKQFYVALYDAAGEATFAAPGSFTWATFGGVATVDAEGFVQGQSAGSGTVVATHVPSGLQGGATLTIQSTNVTTGKWTILVYMNAANDLYQFSDFNVNQMEQVAGNPDVRFVVQWKQSTDLFSDSTFNGTRRYLVKPDNTGEIASELVQNMGLGVDMGDKSTLLQFINWGKTFYPAQRYCLVIWNHGNGWRRGPERQDPTRAVSYDDQTGNSIQTWELAQALGSNHFDILAWDASLMQMIEVADEVQDNADYIVGSEESPPGKGYPYHLVFDDFRDNPDDTTLNLSKSFVDAMVQFYQNDGTAKVTQSVIDTNEIPNLVSQIDNLGDELSTNSAALTSIIQNVRANAKSYSPTGGRVYRDLWDVCDRIQSQTGIVSVQNACAATKAAIEAAVKWEGHKASSDGSHGISIDFSSAVQFAPVATDYGNLRFSNETSWNEWLAVAP